MDDDGVTFTSVYDGSPVRLTPESAVEAQGLLGADIQMVLDVCASLPGHARRCCGWPSTARRPGPPGPGPTTAGSRPGPRARRCSASCRAAPTRRSGRRAPSARWRCDFDGYGIGGLSVGEPRAEMLEALAATVPHLPADRPRYLMGVGDPVGLLEAVALGVDQFDCVAPTRVARHGTAWTSEGRVNLRNAALAADDGPLDPACACPTCARWPRGSSATWWRWGSRRRGVWCRSTTWPTCWASWTEARAAVAAGTLDGARARTGTRSGTLARREGPVRARGRPGLESPPLCAPPPPPEPPDDRRPRPRWPACWRPPPRLVEQLAATILIVYAAIAVAFYFFFWRPQQKRAQAAREQGSEYEVGDEVLTAGGIVGHIIDIQGDRYTLETSVGASFVVLKQYVIRKLTPVEPPSDDDEDGDHEPEPTRARRGGGRRRRRGGR